MHQVQVCEGKNDDIEMVDSVPSSGEAEEDGEKVGGGKVEKRKEE